MLILSNRVMKKHENIPNKNPFKVPEDYFDTLTDRVMSKIGEAEETKIIAIPFIKRVRPYLALAAMITAFALITTVIVKLTNQPEYGVSDLAASEFMFDETMINDIDLYLIEEQAALMNDPLSVPDVDKEAIIDYLVNNDVALSNIYELL